MSILIVFSISLARGQYAFRSAAGNSGIVVGSNNASKFTGINYDLSSSKLGLSFRQTTQNLKNKRSKDVISYPDLIGHNLYLGFGINSGKATLIKNSVWQGSVEAAYDFSYTRDKTPIDPAIPNTGSRKTILFFSTSDSKSVRTLFKSKRECENQFGVPCNEIEGTVSYYELDDYENRSTLLKQNTWFFRISGGIGRQNLALPAPTTGKDSVTLTDEFYVVPRIAVGLNKRIKFTKLPKVLFTGAPSLSYYFIPKSTGLLKEFLFQQVSKIYNGGTVTQMTSSSNKNYFLGSTEYEGVLGPRLDLVTSVSLGTNKPYVNIIGAYSPTLSTFSSIGWKQNYAIGVGISLPVVPDQMLFAILYEGLATNIETQKTKAVTFYASVPFSFK